MMNVFALRSVMRNWGCIDRVERFEGWFGLFHHSPIVLDMLFMKFLVSDHLRSGERTVTTLVVAPRGLCTRRTRSMDSACVIVYLPAWY